MQRLKLETLIIGDSELECKCKNLSDINITTLSFGIVDLEKFDLIIYVGSKGTKVVKSVYTKTGAISD